MNTTLNNLKERNQTKQRIKIISLFLSLLFFAIFLRIFQIQIIDSEEYSKFREGSIRKEPDPAIRGEIVDRNDLILVCNNLSTKLTITPADFIPSNIQNDAEAYQTYMERLSFISQVVNVPVDYIRERIEVSRERSNPNEPKIIKNHLSAEELTLLEEHSRSLPGVSCTNSQLRRYLAGHRMAHLLGVTGYISPEQLAAYQQSLNQEENNLSFTPNSIVGTMGVEKAQDRNLRGIDGEKNYLVNIYGERIPGSEHTIREPQHGLDLRLTVDYGIQEMAYRALGNKLGCVIVTDATNGEILALVSSPSFDPNNYSESFYDLMMSEDKPLINRATMGYYPPSSPFKLITAATILEAIYNDYEPYKEYWDAHAIHDFDPYDTIDCRGGRYIGREWFGCNKIHGRVNLHQAIQHSCNTYFYSLGLTVGWDAIYDMATHFGLGETLKMDFGYETTGLLPDKRWKDETFNTSWYDGNTAHAVIGQGYLLLSPIQVHNIVSAIATGGTIYKPHAIKEVYNRDTGEVVYVSQPEVIEDKIVSNKTIEFIRDSMRDVVLDGTAYYARFSREAPIAGKTGTAENPYGEPHGWFTCYAPYTGNIGMTIDEEGLSSTLSEEVLNHNPVVVTVFVENGGSGGISAAPIAAAVVRYIFERNPDRDHLTMQEVEDEAADILSQIEREMGLTIYVPTTEDIEESYREMLEQSRIEQASRQRDLVQQFEERTMERIWAAIQEDSQQFESEINAIARQQRESNQTIAQSSPPAQESELQVQSQPSSNEDNNPLQTQENLAESPSTSSAPSGEQNETRVPSNNQQSTQPSDNTQARQQSQPAQQRPTPVQRQAETQSSSTQRTTQTEQTTSQQFQPSSENVTPSQQEEQQQSNQERTTQETTQRTAPSNENNQPQPQQESAPPSSDNERNQETVNPALEAEDISETIEEVVQEEIRKQQEEEMRAQEEMRRQEEAARRRMQQELERRQALERQQEQERRIREQQEEQSLPEEIRRRNEEQNERQSREMADFMQNRMGNEELRNFIETETRRLQDRMGPYDRQDNNE